MGARLDLIKDLYQYTSKLELPDEIKSIKGSQENLMNALKFLLFHAKTTKYFHLFRYLADTCLKDLNSNYDNCILYNLEEEIVFIEDLKEEFHDVI